MMLIMSPQILKMVLGLRLYVPVVSLSTKDNLKLTKQLTEGFKRSVYCNKYKVIPNKQAAANEQIREFFDASYQGVKRLFVLAYSNVANGANQVDINSFKNTFFQECEQKITKNKLMVETLIVNQLMIKRYDKIKKTATVDDYKTGCLLDYKYFKEIYQWNVADVNKRKVLDADPRVIQQIIFTGEVETNSITYYILEESKETILEFYKGATKVYKKYINGSLQ